MALTIALLRAVNVGGRKLVAMADLRAMMADLGFGQARSLLQSGNLVFEAGRHGGAELEARLEVATLKRFDLATDYLVRTSDEWARIVASNPFPDMARDDPARLVVMPLKAAPTADRIGALQAAVAGRGQVHSLGQELYITYPDGIGTSKLTGAIIERKLATRGTARNWNTVLKLAAMVAA